MKKPVDRMTTTFAGKTTQGIAVMPKIWLDVASRIMQRPYASVMGHSALATQTLVDAAKTVNSDGVRLLLFPQRNIIDVQGRLIHVDKMGQMIGEIDVQGGWSTRLAQQDGYNVSNPEHTAHYQLWHSKYAPIRDQTDLIHFAVPKAAYYEESGFGSIVDAALISAGPEVCCVGDCNSGTMAFLVAMRGMEQGLLDLYDNETLTHLIMEKGIEMSLERARFFISHGVRVLRYNDSVGNMSVISRDQWRTYVMPHLRFFCSEVHRLEPEAKIYCHICGNVLPILEDLVACGLDCIAPLDPLGGFTIKQARAVVGKSMILMGGVNTMSFINKTPAEMVLEAEQCILEGAESGGFILGSGCVLPRMTRIENLEAMIQTAHEVQVQEHVER